MFALACLIIAGLLFLLAAFVSPQPTKPQLMPIGLFFVVIALLIPMLR